MHKTFSGLLAGFLAIFAFGLSAPAFAADKYTPPLFSEDEISKGKGNFYIGITAGVDSTSVSAMGVDLGETGLAYGLIAGYDYRMASGWVVGLETGIEWNNVDFGATGLATAEADYIWNVGVRTGPTIGNALLYAAVGIAGTTLEINPTGIPATDESYLGWYAGAGMEIDVAKNVFLRLEGRHYMFPDENFTFAAGTIPGVDNSKTVFRIGTGMKF